MANNTQELKPCPFCGGEAMLIKWQTYTPENQKIERQNVFCNDCGIRTGDVMPPSAIEKWNRRNTLLSRLRRKVMTWLKN